MEKLLQVPCERRKNITFPLPRDTLPNVRLTPEQVREYRKAASIVVDKTIEMERLHRGNGEDLVIAAGNWKLAKETRNLRMYRRTSQTRNHSEQQEVQPMMLCVGTIHGTVEETLYGLHEETTDEMQAINAIVNKSQVDSAVVAVMDRGTSRDPLRLLALKWRLHATPGGSFIKNRDSLTLESMGIQTDRRGEKFGHILLKSIDHPDFPAFSSSGIIRSRVMLCCVFRQLTSDTVAVYAKGIMDIGGDLSEWLCYNFAFPRLAHILGSTRSQRAKQLTSLSIKNGRVFLPVNASMLGFTRIKMSSRATMRCTSIQTECTASDSSDSSRGSRWQPPASLPNTCLLCQKRSCSVPWLGSSLQSCQICDRIVCRKCLVKRELLAVPSNIQVWCCKGCVIVAKTLPIDPHVLCPMLQY